MFLLKPIVDVVLPLVTNFGMQYVSQEFSVILKSLFTNYYIKIIIFYCIFLSVTKNPYISLCLTILIVVLFLTIYNKDSKYNILGKYTVSDMEIANAKKVLETADNERKEQDAAKAKEFEKDICNYAPV